MDLLNPQMRFCVDLSSDYETRNVRDTLRRKKLERKKAAD